MEDVYRKLNAYAYFQGSMTGIISDICMTSRQIVCDGNYKKMYEHLVGQMKEANNKLEAEQKEIKNG
jgi:hypothetical protein